MSVHYAIVNDLSNSPRESAIMEVSADVLGNVEFVVYPPGAPPTNPIVVPTNNNHLATTAASGSPNLFTLTNGKSAIVQAKFDAGYSAAILRQKAGGSKILLAVPRKEQSLGTSFIVPIGDVGSGAVALVGNPSSMDANVELRCGSPTSAVVSTTRIGPWNVGPIALQSPDCSVLLKSNINVFVQLAIDTGKVDETFILPG